MNDVGTGFQIRSGSQTGAKSHMTSFQQGVSSDMTETQKSMEGPNQCNDMMEFIQTEEGKKMDPSYSTEDASQGNKSNSSCFFFRTPLISRLEYKKKDVMWRDGGRINKSHKKIVKTLNHNKNRKTNTSVIILNINIC